MHISAARYTILNSRELFKVLAAFCKSSASFPEIAIFQITGKPLQTSILLYLVNGVGPFYKG